MKGKSVQELLGEIPTNAEEMAIPKELRENAKMFLGYWPKLNFDLKGTWFGNCTRFFSDGQKFVEICKVFGSNNSS